MNNKEMVEIWGDIVELKALNLAVVISSTTTMGGYFFGTKGGASSQRIIFFGLGGGAVLGFIISTILIKPKRDINIEK